MNEIGKKAGLDQFTIGIINFLNNRISFYMTLICIYDKAVTNFKEKELSQTKKNDLNDEGNVVLN